MQHLLWRNDYCSFLFAQTVSNDYCMFLFAQTLSLSKYQLRHWTRQPGAIHHPFFRILNMIQMLPEGPAFLLHRVEQLQIIMQISCIFLNCLSNPHLSWPSKFCGLQCKPASDPQCLWLLVTNKTCHLSANVQETTIVCMYLQKARCHIHLHIPR